MSAERSVTAVSTPAALVDAHAREREALGDLVPELLVMRDRERGSTGSTFYAATLAALVDHRWPVTALARIVGEDYASIQGRLADPGAGLGRRPSVASTTGASPKALWSTAWDGPTPPWEGV